MVESDFPIYAYVESRSLLEHASLMAESAGVDRGSWLRLAVSLHASDCIDYPDRAAEDFLGSIINVFEAAETDEGEYFRVPMRSQIERDDVHQIVASRDEDMNDFIIRAIALRVDEWLEGGWDKALTGNPNDIPDYPPT